MARTRPQGLCGQMCWEWLPRCIIIIIIIIIILLRQLAAQAHIKIYTKMQY